MTELEQEAIEFMKKQPKDPESQHTETDLERQLAICEQNGTKWAHFKVSEIAKLRAELETAKQYGRTEYGIEQILRADIEKLRADLAAAESSVTRLTRERDEAREALRKLPTWEEDVRLRHEALSAQPTPKVEETKYLKLLRWFKLFYDFYQKDVAGKPSACASALAEDGELQEFIREANRIG